MDLLCAVRYQARHVVQCPVLSERMGLRDARYRDSVCVCCYAMRVTELAYAATRMGLPVRSHVPGTEREYGALPTDLLHDARY
eukprot:3941921-Rhodomonas_salina.3